MRMGEAVEGIALLLLGALLGFLGGLWTQRFRVGLDLREKDKDVLREIHKALSGLDSFLGDLRAIMAKPAPHVFPDFHGNARLRIEEVEKAARYEIRHRAHRKVRRRLLAFASDPPHWTQEELTAIRKELERLIEP